MPQGALRSGRVSAEHVRRDPCVHLNHRDMVGDHIMQLAGEPEPLLGHPPRGFLPVGLLDAQGPLLHSGGVGAAASHCIAGRHRQAGPGQQAHVLGNPPRPRPPQTAAAEQQHPGNYAPGQPSRPAAGEHEGKHGY